MTNSLTAGDLDRAGWCDHGRRIMKQGRKRNGGYWRGEFCFLNECEVMWWRFNPQIIVQGDDGMWISPMYEPLLYVELGLKGSPWENM